MEIIIILLKLIFVLFLPGFIISFVFFDKGKNLPAGRQVDVIERVALSFALSIAVVPLVVFYLNLLGIPINKITVIYQVLMVISIAGVIIAIKKLYKHKIKHANKN